MPQSSSTQEKIAAKVASHRIVLYMKGTPQMPQCGFSARTSGILDELLEGDYASYNVLEDDLIREGIKVFGDWPTISMLYVVVVMVGGLDMVRDMYGICNH